MVSMSFLLYYSAPPGAQPPRNAGWHVGVVEHQRFDIARRAVPAHQTDTMDLSFPGQMKSSGCWDKIQRGSCP